MVRERLYFQNSPVLTFNSEKTAQLRKISENKCYRSINSFCPDTIFVVSSQEHNRGIWDAHVRRLGNFFFRDAYMPHQAKMSLIRWQNLLKKVRWQNLSKIFISRKEFGGISRTSPNEPSDFCICTFSFHQCIRHSFWYTIVTRHYDVIKWKHFPRYWPLTRPVTRSFDVFFDLRLNKPLNKQSWG